MKFKNPGIEINESDLISGCKTGDGVSRRYLYEIFAPKMMGICFRYTCDMQVSEDLLHDGFIRVYEAIRLFQYRGPGSLKAWMGKIFTNIALDYLRKNSFKESVSLDEIEEPENLLEENFETIPTAVLMRFLAELPEGYRTVFNLYAFEEMSHKEIAGLLHINESSSRSQLTRAKTILAKKIKTYICQHE
jgi:RNA polymerase sigma-70 factor (ECF subfamily)